MSHSGVFHSWASACALAAGALIGIVTPAAAQERRLAPGDVVEMIVPSMPDLTRRLAIGIDGTIELPVSGTLQAGGQTLDQLASAIRHRMTTAVFAGAAPSSRNSLRLLAAREIVVRMAEYRPVYVSGDVAVPGAHVFRPGLNIRQAIALAGGYDVTRASMLSVSPTGADISRIATSALQPAAKDGANTLHLDLEREEAALARLQDDYEASINAPQRDRLRLADLRQGMQLASARILELRRRIASSRTGSSPSGATTRIEDEVVATEAKRRTDEHAGTLRADVTIIRGTPASAVTQQASNETLVEPGDVLEVTLRVSQEDTARE